MRSDNLQLPCVQPPTSSYNFQLPHGRHSHGGRGQDRTGHFRIYQIYVVFAYLCLILSIYNDFYAFKESVKNFCNLNVQNRGEGVNNVFLNKVKTA